MWRVIPVVVLIICQGVEQASYPLAQLSCLSTPKAISSLQAKQDDAVCSRSTCYAVLPPASAGPLLTTSNGVIYDANGNPVKLRGIGWFGFNTA